MSNISMTTSKRNAIVTVMLISAFVSMLNQTILNTALPAIIKGLNITETTAQWLITGFMLVNGIMIPLTAFLMDKYSTRHLYIFSMAIFLIGSVVAAVSPTFSILIISRIIQAIGAGILLPLMQFTVFTLFPAEQRGFAMGLAGVVVQSAPAIGPTLTGLFVDLFSWRMPFYLVSAIAAVAFILGFFFVENNTKTKDIILDKISVVYSTFGFGLILFAFSSVSTFGITSLPVIVTFVLGIAIIIIFTTRQLKLKYPLLNMRVFKNKVFTLSAMSSMLVYITMVSPALLIPIYIQTGLGQSALLSGVVVLPGAVINGLTMVYTGKIFDKHGIKVLVIPGFILLISMTFLYSFLTTGTPYWFVILVYTIRMIALGLLVMPLNTVGLNALKSDDVSHGTAIMNSLRIIAGAMGTAVSVTILSIVAKQYTASHSTMSKMKLTQEATVHGIDVAFIFTTVLIIIGFILALFIKEEKNH
ncbi:MDR family MFS transporter [Staphylococcus epidermidis]|uniref:MDR family MFS transporter n=1 Tax=Staphylococcus epidermidis TaxID=1282 RepID=UPI0002FA9141|nr:MDR family MFS transporter [Staphylococcus epidermidis]